MFIYTINQKFPKIKKNKVIFKNPIYIEYI